MNEYSTNITCILPSLILKAAVLEINVSNQHNSLHKHSLPNVLIPFCLTNSVLKWGHTVFPSNTLKKWLM